MVVIAVSLHRDCYLQLPCSSVLLKVATLPDVWVMSAEQSSRKRVQQLKKRKMSHFLDFQKTINVKSVCTHLEFNLTEQSLTKLYTYTRQWLRSCLGSWRSGTELPNSINGTELPNSILSVLITHQSCELSLKDWALNFFGWFLKVCACFFFNVSLIFLFKKSF